ncbi:hypothetical protein N0V90_006850 [Kalmusia sp. IMI 367209]|nr:hypothetical protein N0V90_006850 [Kalmusia sp. IMI 367209]
MSGTDIIGLKAAKKIILSQATQLYSRRDYPNGEFDVIIHSLLHSRPGYPRAEVQAALIYKHDEGWDVILQGQAGNDAFQAMYMLFDILQGLLLAELSKKVKECEELERQLREIKEEKNYLLC